MRGSVAGGCVARIAARYRFVKLRKKTGRHEEIANTFSGHTRQIVQDGAVGAVVAMAILQQIL